MSYDGTILKSELLDDIEIEADDVIENHRVAMQLTGGKKFLSLVISAPYSSITKEGRKEATLKGKYQQAIAQAIVTKSLANKIMGNFLVKFYRAPCPMKLFDNEEQAIKWLKEQLPAGKQG